jgi:tRNA pseudouridine55 synthase
MTSHDVVAITRRLTGQRSVGHAGTLDPLASGVLVVLLGRATSLSSYAMSSAKTYAAEIVFGVATDTDDAEGRICAEGSVPSLSREEIADRLQDLAGVVMQAPPKFSAIKQGGKTSYVEARRGRAVDLPPRRVEITRLGVLSWQPPRLRIVVTCGAGTYIRSLARDAGELLGSAAYLHTLVRVSSGGFHIRDAVRVADLTPANIRSHVLPPDAALENLRAEFVGPQEAGRIRHGRTFELPPMLTDGEEVIRVYGDGVLLALARPIVTTGATTPDRPEESDPAQSSVTTTTWQPFRVMESA